MILYGALSKVLPRFRKFAWCNLAFRPVFVSESINYMCCISDCHSLTISALFTCFIYDFSQLLTKNTFKGLESMDGAPTSWTVSYIVFSFHIATIISAGRVEEGRRCFISCFPMYSAKKKFQVISFCHQFSATHCSQSRLRFAFLYASTVTSNLNN